LTAQQHVRFAQKVRKELLRGHAELQKQEERAGEICGAALSGTTARRMIGGPAAAEAHHTQVASHCSDSEDSEEHMEEADDSTRDEAEDPDIAALHLCEEAAKANRKAQRKLNRMLLKYLDHELQYAAAGC
jgi:hypothetical protein